MRTVHCSVCLIVLASAVALSAAESNDPAHAANMAAGLKLFKQSVRPILVGRCLRCHGGEDIEGEFDLSTREGFVKGSYDGAVAQIGQASKSRLRKLLTHEVEPHMPADGAKLSDIAIDQIVRWVDLGAPYDTPLVKKDEDPLAWTRRKIDPARKLFWSFRPLADAQPPQVAASDSIRTDIDRFLHVKQQAAEVTANRVAPRRKLIRRAYLDLIGLPPTPEQTAAFVADKDPQAYGKLVDELLNSKHYGERWARHWLDVARFAESHGFEQDYDRPHAYHYRDFVIKAFNSDMPYDQFVRWQIAGDEFAPDDPQAMMATGFLGAGVFPTQLTEKEFESARYDELDDMVATLGTSMLGLTTGCARCHDHKFDPIPSADYYRLVATFATAIRSEVDVTVPSDNADKKDEKPKTFKVMVTSEGVKPMKHHADGRGFPHFYPETYYLNRGDVAKKQGVAEFGFLQALQNLEEGDSPWTETPPEGAKTSYRRRSLANWITDADQGAGYLLARVIVNRLWHHHFGRGIVSTPSDFGFQGSRPTHPELLEWLAGELIRNEWRLKPLHRLMMTSAAYMQSAETTEENLRHDPDNQWFWRWQPRRVEAEVIRDSILAVSGGLDRTIYGPGTLNEGSKRRSIYFKIKRSKLIPTMQIFDTPEPLVSAGGRPTTTIAPQALMFMNSPHVRSHATTLANALGLKDEAGFRPLSNRRINVVCLVRLRKTRSVLRPTLSVRKRNRTRRQRKIRHSNWL